ncbi:MAG: hypothetical protein R2796_03755 [Chitinophagaceae bacterium]|nr:hypothetical protein [Chitinophagaceae bacterium]MCB0740534.1 hypothetical protein [Chitinophagaceae bacterium]HQU55938.1 hypothetical protein [Chitinophagaceae bacterium]HQV05134.1 hypothetical protein [Chitinophagaceae bacterium]
MRKLFILITALFVLSNSYGSNVVNTPPLKASEIYLPIGNTGKYISMQELSTIKMKDLQKLTGKKISFFEKIAFKKAQRQLQNSINYDGTFNSKRIEKMMKKNGNGEGFQAGGFFLGFLLGLIGVLIAYLINDGQKRNRVKWAWIGLAVWVGILGIILATGGNL